MNSSNEAIVKQLIENAQLRKWVKQKIKTDRGSEEDVQDVFIEAIAILWKNLENGIVIENPEAFVKTVVRKNWNQLSKKRRLRREKSNNIFFSTQIDSVENEYLDKELITLVRTVIEGMAEPCKKILTLLYLEGKKNKEIPELLNNGKTADWVKRKSYICRGKFKTLLEQFPDFKDLF